MTLPGASNVSVGERVGPIAVCSNRPRPSVQNGTKGHQWWRRDVYHLRGDGNRTLCGVDCSEWLVIGETEIGPDCCTRCARVTEINRLNAQEGV